jgi:selenide,water dikinase
VKRNADARAGDKLVLGKPLGVGVYSAALKKQVLDDDRYRVMIANTTQLNTSGPRLAQLKGVHALTDVTGFGLLGHLLEVCKGSKVAATIHWNRVPLLPGARELVRQGHKTGASGRNWSGYGALVDLGPYGELEQALLTDPQTSGGLLVACGPEAVEQVLALFRADGFQQAAVIGEVADGAPRVQVA